ncbi:SRR1-like protein isoform X2 [Eucyclogobius newberryi]|uniref:SRR1-like protein isoform X2 n=1 Tax=Eucyclogobius newberryi TaxID=166745 RepID=UPI003B5C2319
MASGSTTQSSDLRCEAFYEKWKDELLMAALGIQQHFVEKGASQVSAGQRSSPAQMQCVCYGLGSFSSCVSARYQLAMLLLLLDALKIELSDCFVFDPVFSSGEVDVLKRIGLTVLTENEEGKRQANKPTIFYLMHCGKALYNNLLWKNWSKQCLIEIIIIGNSFCGMKERTIDREFNRDYRYISQITAVCEERLLPCPSHMIDVFSDTAVITFSASGVAKLSEATWVNPPEPQYGHCVDLEIVCKDK